jgi:hemerythrin-like metal-binding protein
MKHFNWKKNYETGNVEIDRQHQYLFKISNDFYTILFADTFTPDNNQLREVLNDLSAYSEFHYNYEKKIFSTEIINSYFDNENSLSKKIHFLINHSEDDIIALYGFAEFLRKWLLKQILILNSKDFKKVFNEELLNVACN